MPLPLHARPGHPTTPDPHTGALPSSRRPSPGGGFLHPAAVRAPIYTAEALEQFAPDAPDQTRRVPLALVLFASIVLALALVIPRALDKAAWDYRAACVSGAVCEMPIEQLED